MSKLNLFSIIYQDCYATITKETIYKISEMLVNRTEKTKISLASIIEQLHETLAHIELDDAQNATFKSRSEYITYLCMLIKFLEPMMEQLETIIDREIIIRKIKDQNG